MWFVFPFYLLVTSGYLVVTCGYLVVTSGYLIATTGYFWLLLVPRFSNNAVYLEISYFSTMESCTNLDLHWQFVCFFSN